MTTSGTTTFLPAVDDLAEELDLPVAGGGRLSPANDYLTAEIYSPPYLFKGARPTISSAPGTVSLGSTFSVQTPDAASVSSVSMIRLPSVTHTYAKAGTFQAYFVVAQQQQYGGQPQQQWQAQLSWQQQQPPQQMHQLVEHLAQADGLRLQHLLAAEREQLTGEVRRSRASLQHFGQKLPRRCVSRQLVERQFAAAVDHGQQVVEIVRDATGEPTNRFEVLCLIQLLPKLFLLLFCRFAQGLFFAQAPVAI